MKWKAVASSTRWNDSIIMYMWGWKWNREKKMQPTVLENCVTGNPVRPYWLQCPWPGRWCYLPVGKNKGNLGNRLKLFICALKLMHLCIRNLYYFIVSYCVLVALVYFAYWTHITIPSEKHNYPHLKVRKGFRISVLHQIASCITPEMRFDHEPSIKMFT